MKKLVALFLVLSVPAFAQTDCRQVPTCEEIGYICSEYACKDVNSLNCPFDYSKKICWPNETECKIGSILYSDLKCYDAACGKTDAIAIVFDPEKRKAFNLVQEGNYAFGPFEVDVPTLTNGNSTDERDGKADTAAIVEWHNTNEFGYEYPAAMHCYNLEEGGLPPHSWWLATITELKKIYDNKDVLAPAIEYLGATPFDGYFVSSTEVNHMNAWVILMHTGVVAGGIAKNGARQIRCIMNY